MSKKYRYIYAQPLDTIYNTSVEFRFDASLPQAEEPTRLDDGFFPEASDLKLHRLYVDNKAMTAEQVEELLGLNDISEFIFDTIMQGDLDPYNYFSPDPEDDSLF